MLLRMAISQCQQTSQTRQKKQQSFGSSRFDFENTTVLIRETNLWKGGFGIWKSQRDALVLRAPRLGGKPRSQCVRV